MSPPKRGGSSKMILDKRGSLKKNYKSIKGIFFLALYAYTLSNDVLREEALFIWFGGIGITGGGS